MATKCYFFLSHSFLASVRTHYWTRLPWARNFTLIA